MTTPKLTAGLDYYRTPGTAAPRPVPDNPVGRTLLVRDALGRAHYERMRDGFGRALLIPEWDDLPEDSREAYRRRLDYVLPRLNEALDALDLLGGTS